MPEGSPDLAGWIPLTTNRLTEARFTYSVAREPAGGARFYRARIHP